MNLILDTLELIPVLEDPEHIFKCTDEWIPFTRINIPSPPYSDVEQKIYIRRDKIIIIEPN